MLDLKEKLKYLDFRLPDFTRVSWGSPEARKIWEPRILAINSAWFGLERLTVYRRMRNAALISVGPEQLSDIVLEAAKSNCIVSPLARTGVLSVYNQEWKEVEEGKPYQFRVAITLPSITSIFIRDWHDSSPIGDYLGYPRCCQWFFHDVWEKQNKIDPTLQMLGESSLPYNNILLRWIGVRPVFHLPCSFNCHKTLGVAYGISSLMNELYPRESSWHQELLMMPVRYSALHGIAIIETPLFRIVTRTDATAEEFVVEKKSTHFPEGSVNGTRFPYKIAERIQIQRYNERSAQANS